MGLMAMFQHLVRGRRAVLQMEQDGRLVRNTDWLIRCILISAQRSGPGLR